MRLKLVVCVLICSSCFLDFGFTASIKIPRRFSPRIQAVRRTKRGTVYGGWAGDGEIYRNDIAGGEAGKPKTIETEKKKKPETHASPPVISVPSEDPLKPAKIEPHDVLEPISEPDKGGSTSRKLIHGGFGHGAEPDPEDQTETEPEPVPAPQHAAPKTSLSPTTASKMDTTVPPFRPTAQNGDTPNGAELNSRTSVPSIPHPATLHPGSKGQIKLKTTPGPVSAQSTKSTEAVTKSPEPMGAKSNPDPARWELESEVHTSREESQMTESPRIETTTEKPEHPAKETKTAPARKSPEVPPENGNTIYTKFQDLYQRLVQVNDLTKQAAESFKQLIKTWQKTINPFIERESSNQKMTQASSNRLTTSWPATTPIPSQKSSLALTHPLTTVTPERTRSPIQVPVTQRKPKTKKEKPEDPWTGLPGPIHAVFKQGISTVSSEHEVPGDKMDSSKPRAISRRPQKIIDGAQKSTFPLVKISAPNKTTAIPVEPHDTTPSVPKIHVTTRSVADEPEIADHENLEGDFHEDHEHGTGVEFNYEGLPSPVTGHGSSSEENPIEEDIYIHEKVQERGDGIEIEEVEETVDVVNSEPNPSSDKNRDNYIPTYRRRKRQSGFQESEKNLPVNSDTFPEEPIDGSVQQNEQNDARGQGIEDAQYHDAEELIGNDAQAFPDQDMSEKRMVNNRDPNTVGENTAWPSENAENKVDPNPAPPVEDNEVNPSYHDSRLDKLPEVPQESYQPQENFEKSDTYRNTQLRRDEFSADNVRNFQNAEDNTEYPINPQDYNQAAPQDQSDSFGQAKYQNDPNRESPSYRTGLSENDHDSDLLAKADEYRINTAVENPSNYQQSFGEQFRNENTFQDNEIVENQNDPNPYTVEENNLEAFGEEPLNENDAESQPQFEGNENNLLASDNAQVEEPQPLKTEPDNGNEISDMGHNNNQENIDEQVNQERYQFEIDVVDDAEKPYVFEETAEKEVVDERINSNLDTEDEIANAAEEALEKLPPEEIYDENPERAESEPQYPDGSEEENQNNDVPLP